MPKSKILPLITGKKTKDKKESKGTPHDSGKLGNLEAEVYKRGRGADAFYVVHIYDNKGNIFKCNDVDYLSEQLIEANEQLKSGTKKEVTIEGTGDNADLVIEKDGDDDDVVLLLKPKEFGLLAKLQKLITPGKKSQK